VDADGLLALGAGTGGTATLVLAIGWAIRATPGVLERIALAWRKVRSKQADVDHAHAENDALVLAELRRMGERLDGCEERHAAAIERAEVAERTARAALDDVAALSAEIVVMRERLADAQAEVAMLRAEMERRRWTPPGGFPAAPKG
jgi:hypothetical protein